MGKTTTEPLREKNNAYLLIHWQRAQRREPWEHMFRNLSVAAALVVCAMALRHGAVPSLTEMTDVVLAAATDQTLLDEKLGRLSFVSSLFPEATLVFGEKREVVLAQPVFGGSLIHSWAEEEPYQAWNANDATVFASMEGTVMGVYHGENEERLVDVMGADGLTCRYGNLETVIVRTGDWVERGDVIGSMLDSGHCTLEVFRYGVSVDPASYLPV